MQLYNELHNLLLLTRNKRGPMAKGKAHKIFKAILITISIPIILLWLLIILLYIPPVQNYVVDEVCETLEEESGLDISISSFRLAFPLKLKITDLVASRNDTIFVNAGQAEVNISIGPLLSGEIEVNYVQLENIDIDTKDLLPDMTIDGNIGFFRVVARNIDLENEIANIRQVHLHSTDLNILLKESATEEEEEPSEPLKWLVRLRRANIERCNFCVTMPGDTLAAKSNIGKIYIEKAKADLNNEDYHVGLLSIKNTNIKYDQGTKSITEDPLGHLELNEINFEATKIDFNGSTASVQLKNFAFIQPGGIRVTKASAEITSNSEKAEIKDFTLQSKNGSYISCSTTLPWDAIVEGSTKKLSANLKLGLKKADLRRVLAEKEYESLSIFSDDMLAARLEVNGNIDHLDIKEMYADIPGITSFEATGNAKDILNMEKLSTSLDIRCNTGNVRELLGYSGTGDGNLSIEGNVKYATGEASADLVINGGGGDIIADVMYNINNDTYDANIAINRFNLTKLIPDIPLYNLTMQLKANGVGIDLFDTHTAYNAGVRIDSIHYDTYRLDAIEMSAKQSGGKSDIALKSDDPNLKMQINAGTILGNNGIKNSTTIDIADIRFKELGLSEAEVATKMKLDIKAATDFGESHSLAFNGEGIRIITTDRTYTPAALSINVATSPDTSYINASNGDLAINGTMGSGYTALFAALDKAGAMYSSSFEGKNMKYHLNDYEKVFPELSFKFECGQKNILYNFLAMNGISTDRIAFDISLDSIRGFNMNSGIYGFKSGETNLDTIRFFTRQDGNTLKYLAGVRSTSLTPGQEKETYSAAVYGDIQNDTLATNIMFRDKDDEIGIKMGLAATLMPKGLDIRFKPDAILMGNMFHFNEENYLNIGEGMSIDADITLSNDDDAGMHLYTTPDPDSKYNANLELFNIDLNEVTALVPYAPDLSGTLNLDLHYRDGNDGMLISCDAIADSLSYENNYIGNEIFEAVYFPKNDNTHHIDLLARHEEEEIIHINGSYDDGEEAGLDGKITLTQFPLAITNAFLKDSGIGLDGFINCDLSAKGPFSRLKTNGYMQFNSVNADIDMLNATFALKEEKVRITNNKLRFSNFEIYDKATNPFKINGTVDLSNLSDPEINLRMNADNYELINSPRKRGAMIYGKLFLDIKSFIRGTLKDLNIFGNVGVLGKSDITYVLLDAPIESDKELDGLVEFVNFQDTLQNNIQESEEIDLGNMTLSLILDINENARINADFDENRSSYIMLQGGGNLHLTYTGETGMNVTGSYTMKDGQLKYTLPVIPLKTFSISDGSKVTWTGDIADPEIEITALERVTSSVTFDDNSMIPVAFDVGVKLSNTLSNMGLSFTMSAPENAIVQDQLNQLDAETMNKYAVTMLITGAYMGSSKGMTVSNALSSFLDAKINNLAGSAMKSVSVNVGINDAQNAETGGTYKNYSFSFSKRFWNDRLTIVIGGEVNSGNHAGNNDSFINNVSLEWKISNNSNRYLRIFYDKNYKSILEGEIIETGIGYIYKRKLNNLKELFLFKKKAEETPAQPARRMVLPVNREAGNNNLRERGMSRDSISGNKDKDTETYKKQQ